MTDDLHNKYRNDELTVDELHRLRAEVNAADDETISHMLRKIWEDDDARFPQVEQGRVDRLKKRIDTEIDSREEEAFRPNPFRLAGRIWRIAAAVLLPLFIVSTGYFFYKNKQLTAQKIIVSTGDGERARVTLPDGTEVVLNSLSKLSYFSEFYKDGQRGVEFDGEGYFEVSKDKKHPFSVRAEGLVVNVLGTKFNLDARSDSYKASVSLEEGSVELLSLQSGKKALLAPGEKAVLNRNNGQFTVETVENIEDASAWRKGDLIFRNTPLYEVFQTVEQNYGVTIQTPPGISRSALFTGTLPSTNLNEVLEILETSLHATAAKHGHKIEFTEKNR